MLSDLQLEDLFIALSLPESGRALVRKARQDSPVRDVSNKGGINNLVDFFSRKMGNRHLKLESLSIETPAATVYEQDSACLEYWPQPITIDLFLPAGRGRTRRQHTPDFLVVRREGIFVHEWRDEMRLHKLSQKGHIVKEDGRWRYPAAEEHFASHGIVYELHSNLELNQLLVENATYLDDYRDATHPSIDEEQHERLIELVAAAGSVSFHELRDDLGFSADTLLWAIAGNRVYVDLEKQRLKATQDLIIHSSPELAAAHALLDSEPEPEPVPPFPGMGIIKPGSQIKYDSEQYTVQLVGAGSVLLISKSGQPITLSENVVRQLYLRGLVSLPPVVMEMPTPARTLADIPRTRLRRALERMEMLEGKRDHVCSDRTLYRYKAAVKGADTLLDAVVALADGDRRGNRAPRLPELCESIAADVIKRFYNTHTIPNGRGTYAKYQAECEKVNVIPMAYSTFMLRVKHGVSIRHRQGPRVAYQEESIPYFFAYESPIEGCYPHEICYIDHTVVNLATCGPGGSDLKKPVLTIATDGHTSQIRAFYLSYDPPSVTTVFMVLRDYVRRHNRLPKRLVLDGGKEFRSKEVKAFAKLFVNHITYRPGGKPRGGAPVERALGATEEEIIAQLEGNTRQLKQARTVTKGNDPFRRRKWTLVALHGSLEEYFFNIRENRNHPRFNMPPREYEQMRLADSGLREMRFVRFDENFLLMTSPHPSNHFHKIDRTRGVWVDNNYHWHDSFRHAKKGEKVEVRIEPWNAAVIYVYFNDRWVAAFARIRFDLLWGRMSRAYHVALREEKKRAKTNAHKSRLTAAESLKLVETWTPEVFDPRLAEQHKEMEHLYQQLGMTTALPLPAAPSPQPTAGPDDDPPAKGDVKRSAPPIEKDAANSSHSADSGFWETEDGYV